MGNKRGSLSLSIRLAVLGAGLVAGARPAYPQAQSQSRHSLLFNGKDLTDWETQGLATWSVVNGEILGQKTPAQASWAHLVSKQSFTDCYLRLKYKIDAGNSGAYLRGKIEGDFGVTGLQVEMGGNDGSMMTVTPKVWKWLPGNPVANPLTPMGTWHELAVEIKGRNAASYIDSKQFMQQKDLDTALVKAQGHIAFQLHAGGAQNTVHFKDVEVFTPTLIAGCTDSAYNEFNPNANAMDSAACKRLKPVSLGNPLPGEGRSLAAGLTRGDFLRLQAGLPDLVVRNVRGCIVARAGRVTDAIPPGIYFLSWGKKFYPLILF